MLLKYLKETTNVSNLQICLQNVCSNLSITLNTVLIAIFFSYIEFEM